MLVRKHIFLSMIVLTLSGCITEYEHPGIDHLSGILVVEGTITNDSTFVTLTRTVALDENITDAVNIDDAYVTVEDDNGIEYYGGWKGDGRYFVLTGELNTGTRYRMKIDLDGHTYVSEFIAPLITPGIDELKLTKAAPGEDVHLRLTTYNTNDVNTSKYYRWSFEEIWEYRASYAATHYQEPYLNGVFDEPDRKYFEYDPLHSPYYYCWAFNNSNRLLVTSTVKLTENTVKDFSINNFLETSNRMMMLYYVKVKQNVLHKEAYDYFSNQKDNAEETGSIFGPIPSEMKGNIRCVTDENIPVVGYVDVSTTIEFEKFFSYADGDFVDLYVPIIPDCPAVEDLAMASRMGLREEWALFTLFSITQTRHLYTFPGCIDCRRTGAYHDRKPSFWPNDHF